MEILFLVVSAVASVLCIYFALKLKSNRQLFEAEKTRLIKECEDRVANEQRVSQVNLQAAEERYNTLEKNQEELRKIEERSHQNMREEQEVQFEKKMALMKAEFEKLAGDILEKKSAGMKQSNEESISAILNPLKERMEMFKREVEDSKKSGIETSSTMKEIIKGLMEQTQRLGTDANNLAEALKAKPKMQGNWGEAILKDILENSGLKEGQEFVTQESVSDENGGRLIPDVVVKFPENRSVIIDSKVSLTAYADYMCCDDEVKRAEFLKAHLDSVRQHVKELSDKNYAGYVKNSMGVVLMFMPNEGAYILAMQNDTNLASEAYRRNVVIINPTNLMMTLNLVYSLWQTEKQGRNVEKIITSANAIYDKFSVFSNTFVDMKNKIDSLNKCYEDAEKQLASGRGNITKQLMDLKVLGVSPKKDINMVLAEKAEE